jgi:hydroxyacylglutathione hydrolase
MSTAQILRVPILPFRMVNAHIIKTEDGCIVVDAGIPGSERKIGKVLAQNGMSYTDIKLIIVTHAHTDHAGSAARLRALSGAPIMAHQGDLDYYTRKKPMTFCTTGLAGRLFFKTPVPHQPFEAFEPDILMSDAEVMSLKDFGVDGIVRHTGGHTPGSIAVELSSEDALVGDLIASGILIGGLAFTGRAIRPPFEDDPHHVADELERLVQAGAKRFYMGHGGPLEVREVMRHVRALKQITPHVCAHTYCDHLTH